MNHGVLPVSTLTPIKARNRLIQTLAALGVSPYQIWRADISQIHIGSVLGLASDDGFEFITLTGTNRGHLNDWQILRARCHPKCDALFLALTGGSYGLRLSHTSIKAIIRNAAAIKPLDSRFAEHSDNQKGGADIMQNKPVLRVIQGGRRR